MRFTTTSDHLRAAVYAVVVLLAVTGEVSAAAEEGKDDGDYVTFTGDRPAADPDPGKALVYVVRPTSVGFGVKSFFFVDDAVAGINKGSSWFSVQADPGKRLFWSKSENVDALELEVEAGKTYYIQQHVQIGGFTARTKLEVLDDAEGKSALAQCKKHGTMTEKGRAKGAEIVIKNKKDTQEDLDRRAKSGSSPQK